MKKFYNHGPWALSYIFSHCEDSKTEKLGRFLCTCTNLILMSILIYNNAFPYVCTVNSILNIPVWHSRYCPEGGFLA